MKAITAVAASAMVLATSLAHAQDSHVYVGGGIGRAEIDFIGG
jgi:hypothetical protein